MSAYLYHEKENCQDCSDISCAATKLSGEELDHLHLNSRETTYRRGEIIIREGTLNSHIIYLKSGLVKEFIRTDQNEEQIVSIVKKHSYLGLSSLFGDKINHYSYSALENVIVCNIDVETFLKMVKTNGVFAFEILKTVSKDSLNNFHRFMVLSHKKMYGRIADSILYFSDIIYEKQDFTLPFSRKELAELVGISRESATRVLLKFHEEGILDLSGKKITIKNRDLLQQISKNG
ncbi:MAG: Crp/Fnr family transcriptional regulator [Syntrophothermus sp.]